MKTYINRNLESLLSRLSEACEVYCPIKQYAAGSEEFVLNFDKWKPGAEVDMSHNLTVMPPKEFFFRPFEALYTAEVSSEISITPEILPTEPFVLFGVHACDLRGIELLDSVFLDAPMDNFYKARREAATIVTLACHKNGVACFCDTFDIDKLNPGGDVQINQHGDYFTWKTLTTKGERLTEAAKDLLSESSSGPNELRVHATTISDSSHCRPNSEPENNEQQVKYTLPPSDDLLKTFNSEKWESLYKTCIACGTCTFLCPTCQCYDITDYNTGKKVKCHRAWDSCMSEDFTKMAHGNPRNSHKERFRQRFMHKLVYHSQSGGKYGCTGCGRCTTKCPVNLSILKVIKAMGE